MIIEKIIFLDIDGVALTGIDHLSDVNKNIQKTLRQENPDLTDYEIMKLYCKSAVFNEAAITLLNRLIEKSGAKFVIHSNWRRSVGHKVAKESLIRNGIKESYFHEEYHCPMKMSSEKVHDISFWLSSQSSKDKKIEYIVIDDHTINRTSDYNQVHTDFNKGFITDSYRLAAALLKVDDPEMDITTINEEEMELVLSMYNPEKERDVNLKIAKWLSEIPKGFRTSRSCLLSRKLSDKINSKPSIFNMRQTNDDLYKARSSQMFYEIEYIKNQKRIPEDIIISVMYLADKYDFDVCNEDGMMPESVPCIMLEESKNGNPPKYLYAPKGVDSISYLKGALDIINEK